MPRATVDVHTAFVTGGTRGLGLGLARALADAGVRVALIGRNPLGAAETVEGILARRGHAVAIAADVTDGATLESAAAAAQRALGPIDALICAAGVGSPRAPLWEMGSQAYRDCFDVNVLGIVGAMAAVMPGMVARGRGRVVAIGGTYGHKGVAGFGLYAASKWAVRGLVRSAALDAAPHGVTVNMISPGGIDGERLQRLFRESATRNGEAADAPLRRFTAGTALGRLVEEKDVAAALIHLIGPGGRMMTGQDIIVDSGTIL